MLKLKIFCALPKSTIAAKHFVLSAIRPMYSEQAEPMAISGFVRCCKAGRDPYFRRHCFLIVLGSAQIC